MLCLEGVPDLPVAPQDEAGLTKTFQTWPRGWFPIPYSHAFESLLVSKFVISATHENPNLLGSEPAGCLVFSKDRCSGFQLQRENLFIAPR